MTLDDEAASVSALGVLDGILLVLLLLVLAAIVVPRVAASRRRRRRRALLEAVGRERGARVVALVHGKGAYARTPWAPFRMIDMEDAETVLRALRDAGDRPVDVILHTPGGEYHSALQIARALRGHKGRTRALVPVMAMSGGTLIALGCDEIVMDPAAVLGPVDPQLGDLLRGRHSAAAWARVAREKGLQADDATMAYGDVSEKLLEETKRNVLALVKDKVADPQALVDRIVMGAVAHGYPLSPDDARALGLRVSTDLPPSVHAYLDSFARPRAGIETA